MYARLHNDDVCGCFSFINGRKAKIDPCRLYRLYLPRFHPLLQKAGHASIVHTHTDEWFLVHLTGRPLPRQDQPITLNRGYCPLGRETAIQRLEWHNELVVKFGKSQVAIIYIADSTPDGDRVVNGPTV